MFQKKKKINECGPSHVLEVFTDFFNYTTLPNYITLPHHVVVGSGTHSLLFSKFSMPQ